MANKQTRRYANDMQRYHRYNWNKQARFAAWAVILFVVLCALSVARQRYAV